jgi:hypothetical protein
MGELRQQKELKVCHENPHVSQEERDMGYPARLYLFHVDHFCFLVERTVHTDLFPLELFD